MNAGELAFSDGVRSVAVIFRFGVTKIASKTVQANNLLIGATPPDNHCIDTKTRCDAECSPPTKDVIKTFLLEK